MILKKIHAEMTSIERIKNDIKKNINVQYKLTDHLDQLDTILNKKLRNACVDKTSVISIKNISYENNVFIFEFDSTTYIVNKYLSKDELFGKIGNLIQIKSYIENKEINDFFIENIKYKLDEFNGIPDDLMTIHNDISFTRINLKISNIKWEQFKKIMTHVHPKFAASAKYKDDMLVCNLLNTRADEILIDLCNYCSLDKSFTDNFNRKTKDNLMTLFLDYDCSIFVQYLFDAIVKKYIINTYKKH